MKRDLKIKTNLCCRTFPPSSSSINHLMTTHVYFVTLWRRPHPRSVDIFLLCTFDTFDNLITFC